MTCVLSTGPWHHFNDHIPWSSMNSEGMAGLPSLDSKPQSQGYVSSTGSDTRKSSNGSGKKRASRAGTRSVTTLSAAQLERKRANDREAQRAIRQRTKDHIDQLEGNLNELRSAQESSEKMVQVTQQRNRELENENAYLRGKLHEAGFTLNLPTAEAQRPSDAGHLQAPSPSPGRSSGQRQGSTSGQSTHSNSRQGSWQHSTSAFASGVSTAMGIPGAVAVASGPNVTAWRSHESPQNMADPLQGQSSAPYHQGDRVDWSGNAAPYQYVSQEPQRPQNYETAPLQQQQGYQPPSVQAYGNGTSQPPTYSQMAPQNDFSSLSVSPSPSTYQVQTQPTFTQPASFQVTPMQVPTSGTEYSSPHAHMQPQSLPPFHASHGEPPFAPQPGSTPLQYRDESASRPYSLTHYSTGPAV